jgi:hypothetical protein
MIALAGAHLGPDRGAHGRAHRVPHGGEDLFASLKKMDFKHLGLTVILLSRMKHIATILYKFRPRVEPTHKLFLVSPTEPLVIADRAAD